ncbi:MAG: imidazolonepropionase [Armatimonadetes bacterium]|nr:imidazolonepropionase [Armatimonadota bacterium]
MKKSVDLIILSKELITCQSSSPKSGKDMRDVGLIKNGALAVKEGKIFALGSKEEIISNFKVDSKEKIIWAVENVVLPGLIDCHAHPVFIETRINEFKLRQKEAGYEEIQKHRGGILSSVDKVRGSTFKELYLKSKQNFLLMFSHGATTVESKSGYGLDEENEIKILKINQKLNKDLPLNIISTFLGAHAFPIEYQNNHSGYFDLLINKILLKVKKENLAEFVDVFCDTGAFSKKESAQILKAAQDLGFKLKMHAEEFNYSGAVKLAKFFDFTSLDHLMQIKEEDFSLLKKKNIIAVLLPGTTFGDRF